MIALEKYNPQWGKVFEEEKSILKIPNCLEIHHIGSTAIVGILAKPIVDILVFVSDVLQVGEIDGYKSHGEYGIVDRRYFTKNGINLHVFQRGTQEGYDMIWFVNFMNANRNRAKEYEELKIKLAKIHNDVNEYAKAKTDYINFIFCRTI